MLERMTGMMGLRGGLLVALGLALAVPSVGCGKKKEESTSDDEKSSKKKKGDDDSEKASKKKGDDDDDDKPAKKKKPRADDDDDKPAKSAKKAKAPPKSADDDDDDDEDEDDAPVKKKQIKSLKPAHGEVDITGTWGLAGNNEAGKSYKGTATITKIAGMMFKATWKIGGESQQGIIFKDGNILSCGWSSKHDLGVMAYLVKPGVLDGVWFEEQHTSIGKEVLSGPASTGSIAGVFTIKSGQTPEKKSYLGTVQVMETTSHVFKLSWGFKGSTMKLKGLGMRSNHFPNSDTDVLSAGFNDSGDAGVLQYIIYDGGKMMRGHWAMPSKTGGEPGWGKETMVKAN